MRNAFVLPVAVLLSAGCAGAGGAAKDPSSPSVEAATSAPPSAAPTGPRHNFNVDDMLSFERVGDPSVSPDGKLVAFSVGTPDLDANKQAKDVWLAATDGSFVRRLTSNPAADTGARFAPDGESLYFLSARSGSMQVWRIAVDGGEATQVTNLPVDVGDVVPFPDGKRLLLALDVYPDAATLDETAKRAHAVESSKSKVRVFDQLPVRHWDTWDDGTRTHLFVFSDGHEPVDLLKGLPYDAPTKPFGDLKEVAISKDGSEVVFTSKMVGREDAWSTNSDLWLVPADGSAKPRSLTSANLATDTAPVFSHDGTRLAYLAMARPGFESDRLRVVVLNWKTKKATTLTEAWDRSPQELVWSKDDRALYATADDVGHRSVFAIDAGSGKATTLLDKGTSSSINVAGDRLVITHDDLSHPDELWALDGAGRGRLKQITHLNDAKLGSITFGESEQFSFTGAKGDKVYGWLVKPPGVTAGAHVPVAFLIHGGPQGSFGDHFHYRWNPGVFAGHGFATIAIDFHGSTGYGQAFTDAIRDDWGGAPYEDLMKGLDFALSKYPFLDKDHMAALGASYGGYMINWINGKTDRFKALVCHDGNLDETMAYFQTEELWFPEWEHKGLPWENPEGYARQSPISLVKNWKTPTLVIHGGKDFRIVDAQGMGTFTALQRRNIPSRFVYFPDENHWVLKPANSKRWHEEVFAWIDKFARP